MALPMTLFRGRNRDVEGHSQSAVQTAGRCQRLFQQKEYKAHKHLFPAEMGCQEHTKAGAGREHGAPGESLEMEGGQLDRAIARTAVTALPLSRVKDVPEA